MAYSRKVKFYDATAGNVLIGEINSEDLGIDIATDNVASSDDEGDKPEPVGFGGKMSLKGKFNKDDAGQGGFITKVTNGTKPTIKAVYYGTVGGTGSGYTGTATITNLRLGSARKKYTDVTFDLEWYGTPAWSTTL